LSNAAASVEPAWWQSGVVYQIYPRSFQDTNGDGIGDLEGITRRLGYLVRLGVQAIWISPFYPSPMKDFGYDVSDYTSVDPIFGTLDDFDRLAAAAHDDSDRGAGKVDGEIRDRRAVGPRHLLLDHSEPGVARERADELARPAAGGAGHRESTSITTMRSSCWPVFRSPWLPPGRFRITSPGSTSNSSPSSDMRPRPSTTT